MALPIIKTAIPKRRYQFGEFSIVILGEIESDDGIPYHFLLGIIPEGASTPELFISAEKCPGNQQEEGAYQMRIIAEKATQTVNKSNNWEQLDAFVEDALALVSKLLKLTDEKPMLLL
ncbi:MAG TPA: hypothetical protein ENG03_09015 [Thioploca sp.]|nr:MAG: hypothetical protein DRR19_18245 [Gammaproteobacteria bacterium]HDN27217.1 hypothetical protein [Thioploca sp.]